VPDLPLPDPADYSAPTNWSAVVDAPQLPHPSEIATPVGEHEAAAPEPVPGETQALITPFPADPPTVSGVDLTESVNQAGPA
jgi:hypothetical protein